MKVNLTKKDEATLEEAVAVLKAVNKDERVDRKVARRLAVDLQVILTKHDNRKEKEY